MAPSKLALTTVLVRANKKYLLITKGEIQIFDGWRKLGRGSFEDIILPNLDQGETLKLLKVLSEQKFTQPPPRYSESTLIKALEQRGIGRPSTYAPTISTILYRRYIEKEDRQLKPTKVGRVVTDFLYKNFNAIMDYDFTAQIEDSLDAIAQGKNKWIKVIDEFYRPFIKKVKFVEENASRVKIEPDLTGNKCPMCNQGEEVIRIGRFGKFLSCSRFPECKYTKNYVEKLNLKCPDCKEGEIVVKHTRKAKQFYGCSRYPECKWASWRKPKLDTTSVKSSIL